MWIRARIELPHAWNEVGSGSDVELKSCFTGFPWRRQTMREAESFTVPTNSPSLPRPTALRFVLGLLSLENYPSLCQITCGDIG